jgi:hypothetical protein
MTLSEFYEIFNVQSGVVYRIKRNKTDTEILLDAEQSISTYANSSGKYILVETEFQHEDYERLV